MKFKYHLRFLVKALDVGFNLAVVKIINWDIASLILRVQTLHVCDANTGLRETDHPILKIKSSFDSFIQNSCNADFLVFKLFLIYVIQELSWLIL